MTPAVAVPKGPHTRAGARMPPYLTVVSQNFPFHRYFTSHLEDANQRLFSSGARHPWSARGASCGLAGARAPHHAGRHRPLGPRHAMAHDACGRTAVQPST